MSAVHMSKPITVNTKLNVQENDVKIVQKLASLASIIIYTFWYNRPPTSSSAEYLQFHQHCQHVFTRTRLSSTVVVVSLKYFQKTCSFFREYLQGEPSGMVHAFTACLLLAHKYIDDRHYKNKSFAIASHMDNVYLNKMERQALSCLEYDLEFSREDFDQFRREIKEFIERLLSQNNNNTCQSSVDRMDCEEECAPKTPVVAPVNVPAALLEKMQMPVASAMMY